MTTNWTAIGRRLSVRGTANRPPWGARKARHRPIVAPIAASVAASLAATLALGVGVALARAERDRRNHRRRQRVHRHFGLLPAEGTAEGIRRIALGQLELATELLAGNGAKPDEKAVHETRKALKRLRALMRLLENELGEEGFERENAALRDTGRRLSAARDAEVLVGTLDALRGRHPRELGARNDIATLRQGFLAEREAAAARTLGDPALLAQVLDDLHTIRGRVLAWKLREADGLSLVEPGLQRIYRQGRARYQRAAHGKGDRGRALHEWRKRVKDLRHAAEILERSEPGGARSAPQKRKRKGKKRAARVLRIGRIAKRADDLGELLGEEHDLAVLEARVRVPGAERAPLGRRSRKLLLKRIARRRRRLRARALRDGARLYKRRPKRFARRVEDAFEASSSASRTLRRS